MGLVLHAPLTHCSDGKWNIIPLSPIPSGKEWRDVIGFDQAEHFSHVSIEEAYTLKVLVRETKFYHQRYPFDHINTIYHELCHIEMLLILVICVFVLSLHQ